MSARTYLLAAGAFAIGTSGYIVSGVLPAVSEELHVSHATAGQLLTAFAIAYAISSPLLAALTGRWERRTLLVVALGVAAFGNLLAALAPNYPLLLVARVVSALGAAVYTPAATLVATVLTPPEHRGRAVALGLRRPDVLPGPRRARGQPAGRAPRLPGRVRADRGRLGPRRDRRAPVAAARRRPTGRRPAPALRPCRRPARADGPRPDRARVPGRVQRLQLHRATAGRDRDVEGATIGILLVAYGLGSVLGNWAAGRLTDRFDTRKLLVVALQLLHRRAGDVAAHHDDSGVGRHRAVRLGRAHLVGEPAHPELADRTRARQQRPAAVPQRLRDLPRRRPVGRARRPGDQLGRPAPAGADRRAARPGRPR